MQPDILIFLEAPGSIEFEHGAWTYENRRLRYELGAQKTHELGELARILVANDRRARPTIDPRRGVNVQECLSVLELTTRLGFESPSFAGGQE